MTEHAVGIPESPYLTAVEAMRYLRYSSLRTLYKGMKANGIPHVYRGNRLLFDRRQLDLWLAGERPAPVKPGRPPMKLASTR